MHLTGPIVRTFAIPKRMLTWRHQTAIPGSANSEYYVFRGKKSWLVQSSVR